MSWLNFSSTSSEHDFGDIYSRAYKIVPVFCCSDSEKDFCMKAIDFMLFLVPYIQDVPR